MPERQIKPLYNEVSLKGSDQLYKPDQWRTIPEIVHDNERIHGFFGEFRWLSNFGAATVLLDDVPYDSVERAYQAAKWLPDDRAFFERCTNEESIKHNRIHQPNRYTSEGWNEVKLEVMRFLLEQKFEAEMNPFLAEQLLATGERHLEETNWWNDVYWGVNLEGEGQNNLGKLLMAVRNQLRENGKSMIG